MKKTFFLLFLNIISSIGTISAWDYYERVLIGDLYYNLDAKTRSAEVTYKSYTCNSSATNCRWNLNWNIEIANIPASVEYNDVLYNVTSIGENAFSSCTSLTSVEIPSSVTSIGSHAFSSTRLTSVEIPNNVHVIETMTFWYCSSLTSVTIPSGVYSISSGAFNGCSGLTNIYCSAATPPTLEYVSVFENVNRSTCTLNVPTTSIDLYKAADVWSEFIIVGVDFDSGSTPEKYEITWLNADGGELYTDSLEYGTMPEYKGETPKKESADGYTYTFKGWKPKIAAVTGDAIYIAQFEGNKTEYTIDVTIPDTIDVHGTVIIEGSSTHGDTVTLTANSEDGYYFDSWSDGNTDNPREIVVTEDINVYPIFKKCEEVVFTFSEVITKGESFEFAGMSLSQKGTYSDTTVLANGCDSITILKLNVVKPKTFNLRVVVNDETMGTVEGAGTYTQGQQVTITATPVSNKYVFVRWYNEDEDINIYENPYTFELNRNLQIRAVFRRGKK